ncbi:MAG TPA: RNA 2',3'-cyclic phosphodiesterase [Clostridia bacterium]|jgi:2'-5' RNA ligase|nr:RNA 2',3'-cyclic phosphodiesterase [Clostridia bacterium]
MRLFISINLSEENKKQVRDFIISLKKENIQANFINPENAHITLAFIGETDKLEQIKKTIEKIEFEPFEISINRLGYFNTPSGKILWFGTDNEIKLKELAHLVRSNLKQANIPFDGKNFNAHITIARKAYFDNISIKAPKTNIKVSQINIMETVFENNRPVYKELYVKSL